MRKKRDSAAAALAALFATILPEIGGQLAERVVVRGIEVERAFTPGLHDPGVDQALQMVAEGRRRELDVFLDRTGGSPLWAGLDDEAEDGETHGVAESAKLLCMMLQFRGHALILVFWK
jgi:hypothetical protein